MLIEFTGGFNNHNLKKLYNDTNKVYRNAIRLLKKKDSTLNHQPRIFVVISHGYKVYFECVTLVSNRVYVRTRKAVMDVPYAPSSLKNTIYSSFQTYLLVGATLSLVLFRKVYLLTMLVLKLYRSLKHLKIVLKINIKIK